MESRKIQKIGRSTFSVSLPKDWVNRVGLQPGDTVYINQKSDSVVIVTERGIDQERKPKEYYIQCDLVQESNLLERLIIGGYLMGVDVIKIVSSERIPGKRLEEVRNIVQRLVGASIIEASRNEIILQCFIDSSKLRIYSLIKRLSVIASTMLSEAMEALLKLDPDLAQNVIIREDEADDIYWLITRLLFAAQQSPTLADNIGLTDFFGLISIRLVSKNLERIADCSEGIAKIVLNLHRIRDTLDIRELNNLSALDQLTREVFRKAVDALFSGDITAANDTINLRMKLDVEVEAQIRKAIIPYYQAITIMLAMIAENSATMASEAINIEINKSLSAS